MNCDKPVVKDRAGSEASVANYYLSMAADIILLYFFNNIIYANLSFLVTKDYISCLWAINLALSIGIIGNFILLLYRPRWFPHLVQAVFNILAAFAVFVVFKTFPFTITAQNLEQGVKIALIVIIAALLIGTIIELVKSLNAVLSVKKTNLPGNGGININ